MLALAIFALIGGALFLAGTSISVPAVGAVLFVIAFAFFFAAGVHIAAALGTLGVMFGLIYLDRPFWNFVGEIVWGPSTNFVLVAVPLFILMGEIMLRAGLSDKLYRCLALWTGRLPGGLLHTNIIASGVFSAISGSSVATAATMGSVALPYFARTGYSPRWVLGSVAAGGALGNLIPPGITFILYGLMTETSVGALYKAAIGPSVLVVVLFLLLIAMHGMKDRQRAEHAASWAEKFRSLLDLVPTIILIVLVLGSIYVGWATPTESAALGVVGAIAIAAISRRLDWKMLNESAVNTSHVTAMLGLILFGAYILNHVLTHLGVPRAASEMLKGLSMQPWIAMLLIMGFYIALGTFMEGLSMIIATTPVIFPIVLALGYDPVWFGVVVTMAVEIALISPPDGTVLYVLQGMRKDGGSLSDVFSGVMPFVFVYILAMVMLLAFPQIALYIPNLYK
ncbi:MULTISPECIES: TRAP transporter large permease [Ramlibacter]|uniref:TRAP transporter large permease protein n=1 Tax=Ramlibacter pinisoli TaxID=2682844 RepID=A0A6N8IVM1_9BURK|nr:MULTISPECIES: TRAP transporter large permease [Ramlibacter]MBA2965038.1 TRAP transporter large permease [Ramlibacter sp. CGMCC 1.13660]MVQ30003.1 TRAP transporter large permease subunit [Ramlibacter pinisoli]